LDDTAGKLELFLENTLQMSVASDEEWRMQYDALENLRVLNKFHQARLPLEKYQSFVAA